MWTPQDLPCVFSMVLVLAVSEILSSCLWDLYTTISFGVWFRTGNQSRLTRLIETKFDSSCSQGILDKSFSKRFVC